MSNVKNPAEFTALKRSLEPKTMDLGLDQTGIDRFFVCSVADAPEFDAATWSMTIDGPAAASPTEASLDDLRALPQHDLGAWLECAGNGRRLFELVDGHTAPPIDADTQWTLGAMGMASWRGPRLRDVLALASPTAAMAWVAPSGVDDDNIEDEAPKMCMPADKALHPDTIVALEMNGEPLTAEHGAPARVVVPGWIGAYSVKWLGRIELSDVWVPSWRADVYYQHRLPDGTALGPATAHPVKSCLALDWDAPLQTGTQEIVGYARVPGQPIGSVEWSVDGGDWQRAELVGPNDDWSWSPFRFEWVATPGRHEIRTRATAADGTTQPESMPYHPNTILWNAVTPHPVIVD